MNIIWSSSPCLSTGSEQEQEQAQDEQAGQQPASSGSEESAGTEGVDGGELKKQEMLVQYLRDTEGFALQVERAIAIINNMLYWKTTTGEARRRDLRAHAHLTDLFLCFLCVCPPASSYVISALILQETCCPKALSFWLGIPNSFTSFHFVQRVWDSFIV